MEVEFNEEVQVQRELLGQALLAFNKAASELYALGYRFENFKVNHTLAPYIMDFKLVRKQ